MDPAQRDTIEKKLYADRTFAALKQPRDQFDYILAKYLAPSSPEVGGGGSGEGGSGGPAPSESEWLSGLLAPTAARMQAWGDTHNRKSYKVSKKNRDSARKVLELMDKMSAVVSKGAKTSSAVVVLGDEQRDYLERAERYYSSAILAAPFITDAIAHDMDKVARLKAGLYQERAELRLRTGKHIQAVVDVTMAIHYADQIADHFDYADLKIIAMKCFTEMGLLEPGAMDVLVECLERKLHLADGSTASQSSNEGDVSTPLVPTKEQYQKIQLHALTTLNNTIEYHGQVSNYQQDNAPQLYEEEKKRETYFRHQLADDKVEVRYSPGKGRYMVAREPIPEGAWILVEKPYSAVVTKEYLTKWCNLCLKSLVDDDKQSNRFESDPSAGYPCDYCQEVRFCCLSCFEEAYQAYHKFECGLVGLLLDKGHPSLLHVFRVLSMVGVHKALDYDRLFRPTSYTAADYLTGTTGVALRTKTTFQLSDLDRYTQYRMASTLVEHSDKYCASLDVNHAMQALDVALVLLVKHERDFVRTAAASHRALRDTVLDLLQLCFVNIHRLAVNVFGQFEEGPDRKRHLTATLQVLVGSLVNHSCAPNMDWQIKAGHVVFRANRAIAPNEELNISYGQNRSTPFQRRQDALQYYHFVCSCALCRSDITQLGTAVAKCQSCGGPLVAAHNTACCIECGVACRSADAVRDAVAEIERSYQQLTWYHRMVLASVPVAKSDPSQPSTSLKQCALGVMEQIEACLRAMAYRGTSHFTGALHLLADIYLHLGKLEPALALCKLYEESAIKMDEATAATSPTTPEPSPAAAQTKLVELNFWTEICRKHFALLMARRAPIANDSPLQVAILLYIRFLKLATAYVAARVPQAQAPDLTVRELLERPQYNDAKLAYILSEKKKHQLIAILSYAKSRCNE